MPKQFAEKVLELELEIEHGTFTLKQIQRLMALYSKAVEYYNGKSDGKYLYYQDKIQNLITRPKVLDMLSQKEAEPTSEPAAAKSETDLKTKEELKKKERMLKMNLHFSNQEIEKDGLKSKIIEDHSSAQDLEYKIIQGDLNEQTDSMQKRIEQRRRKMMGAKRTENQTTSSSTPNEFSASGISKKASGVSKSDSGENSVGEEDNTIFSLNFDKLENDKFSGELINRLKLLQEGYDDNEFDDDDLFDEEAVEEEIDQILNKCDEEVEKILEDSTQIESAYEELANQKYERLAEIKAEFNFQIKMAKSEDEKEELTKQRDLEIDQTKAKFDELKEKRISELKSNQKENIKKMQIQRENIKMVTNRIRRSASRKASRRASRGRTPTKHDKETKEANQQATNIIPIKTVEELQDDLSKGLKSSSNKFSDSFKIPRGAINPSLMEKARTPPE